MTPLESDVCRVWAMVLGLEQVDLDCDFFALGGDSLAAAMLAEAIEADLGLDVSPTMLLNITTAREMAAQLRTNGSGIEEVLVPIRSVGAKPPLFAVHDLFGYVFFAKIIAAHVGSDQPLYALRLGDSNGTASLASISAIARRYVAAVRGVQEHGPYRLYGQCVGGIIAFEMALELHKEGETVSLLAVGDAPAPSLLAHGVPVVKSPGFPERVARKVAMLRSMRLRSAAAEMAHTGHRQLERWRLPAAARLRQEELLSMCRSYWPQQRFDGSVLLIRTLDDLGLPAVDRRGWTRDVTGGVHEVLVQCSHDEIGTAPFLSEVARAIRESAD